MRVIFLDVDGVLNYCYTKAFAPSGCIGVASEPLDALEELVCRTGAKIVLTSTWKRGWSRDPELMTRDGRYLDNKLRRKGLRIFDKTTDNMFDRGTGIINWLSKHPDVTSWIVLDDDIFDDYGTLGIMPHLIQTSFMDGGLKPGMIPLCESLLLQSECVTNDTKVGE